MDLLTGCSMPVEGRLSRRVERLTDGQSFSCSARRLLELRGTQGSTGGLFLKQGARKKGIRRDRRIRTLDKRTSGTTFSHVTGTTKDS